MIFFTLRQRRMKNRIGSIHYATGHPCSDIIKHLLFVDTNTISQYHPLRNIIKWFEMMVLQVILFSMYLWHVSEFTVESLTGLEIALQVFQDNTTIGWGNNAPVTWLRAIGEMIFAIIGIGLFGLLVNAVVDVKNYVIEQRRGGNMENPYTNEICIINYPGGNRLEEIIKQIRAGRPDAKFCIMDENLDELPQFITAYGDIEYVRGSTVDADSLRDGARVNEQAAVMVYPKDQDSADSDATTETIVKRVWKLGGQPHIVYYLVSEKNKDLFEGNFHSDTDRQPPKSVLTHTASLIAVQEVLNPGFSSILQRIVRQDTGAAPLCVDASFFAGTTWSQFVCKLMSWSSVAEISVNAMGMISSREVNECPKGSDVISQNATVILTADGSFNWNDFLASQG